MSLDCGPMNKQPHKLSEPVILYVDNLLKQGREAGGQTVKAVVVALEDDLLLSCALSVTQNIDFYRYQVSFKLFKGS